jgi:peptide deformylase
VLEYQAYVRPLVLSPERILRKRCQVVKRHELRLPLFQQTIDDMFATMTANNGVGLAANQIGWNKRIFVLSNGMCAINPRIEPYGDLGEHIEGCLSLPGSPCRTKRHPHLFLRARDRHWKEFVFELHDMPAVIVQHEFDHLEGTMIDQRMVEYGLPPI